MVADENSQDASSSRTGTSLVSRNLVIFGHRTSVRLEDEMWASLIDIAAYEGCTIHELASRIHSRKNSNQSLTSAIRVFLMVYFRDAATQAGHARGQGMVGGIAEEAKEAKASLQI